MRPLRACQLALASLAAIAIGACSALPESVDGPEPTDDTSLGVFNGTVEQAMASTCTTASVKPLSEQIIAEAACIEPGAFVKVPSRPNLVLGGAVFAYLDAEARDALLDALDDYPSSTMTMNSMYRTVAQQYLLYRWYQKGACGIGLAAKPGLSNHETGLALDVSETSTWRSRLQARGFSWLGSKDPPHYDYVGAGATNHKGLDVLAFQRLWNRNYPNDLISEDGDYGPQTEARLKKSPAKGFAKGAQCGAPPPPPAACAHDECDTGVALVASCSECAASVCGTDAYCCTTAWDDQCVNAAKSTCNSQCAAPAACGEFAGQADYTCSGDGAGRGRCVGGSLDYQACANDCLLVSSGPDECMVDSAPWAGCSGSFSKVKEKDGDYTITNFGCYLDENGNPQDDPYDNCIPACLAKAQSSGLCAGLTGPECEQQVAWYAADSGRFGCLARLRVENPSNGKAVVVVALDAGPACWVENQAQNGVLDVSVPTILHLFGSEKGWSDQALVHVVEVSASTPLGPVP